MCFLILWQVSDHHTSLWMKVVGEMCSANSSNRISSYLHICSPPRGGRRCSTQGIGEGLRGFTFPGRNLLPLLGNSQISFPQGCGLGKWEEFRWNDLRRSVHRGCEYVSSGGTHFIPSQSQNPLLLSKIRHICIRFFY